MQEAQIKDTLLFFYLLFLNEQLAVEQTLKVQKKLSHYKASSGISETSYLVRASNSLAQSILKKNKRKKAKVPISANFLRVLSGIQNVDFNVWKSFQVNTDPNFIMILIWSKILKYSYADIAAGLETSTGTVRYRINLAIQELENYNNFNSKSKIHRVRLSETT